MVSIGIYLSSSGVVSYKIDINNLMSERNNLFIKLLIVLEVSYLTGFTYLAILVKEIKRHLEILRLTNCKRNFCFKDITYKRIRYLLILKLNMFGYETEKVFIQNIINYNLQAVY